MTPSCSSKMARPPPRWTACRSCHRTFCSGSPARDCRSSGRRPVSSDSSAMRAERFDERTAQNVATARTSVPTPVANEETVSQTVTVRPSLPRSSRSGDCVPAIVSWAGPRAPPPAGRATGQDWPGGGWTRTRLPGALAGRGGIPAGGQCSVQLAAGGNGELGEHVAEVILGRARADEQPGADLRIRQAVPGQPRHLSLLGGQRTGPDGTGGRSGARAGDLAGGPQLTAGPFGERRHAHLLQHLVGGAQLLTRVQAAALTAQPFPVQQVRPGQLGADPGPAQPLDRLPV